MSKKVLIGCEYSQIIMSKFYEAGFDAYSCDLLECEGIYKHRHLQLDVFEALKYIKPVLFIAHPPCTFLSYAGNSYWSDINRVYNRLEAAKFFLDCYNVDVKFICLENPQGIMNKLFRKPDQVIHPYYFGERQLKRTCLWLKNLPTLTYELEDNLFSNRTSTDYPEPTYINKNGKKIYFTESLNNGHERSKSFESIAKEMVKQWGMLL